MPSRPIQLMPVKLRMRHSNHAHRGGADPAATLEPIDADTLQRLEALGYLDPH